MIITLIRTWDSFTNKMVKVAINISGMRTRNIRTVFNNQLVDEI